MGTAAPALDAELIQADPPRMDATSWPRLYVVAPNWMEYRFFADDLREALEGTGLASPETRYVADAFGLAGLESPVVVLTEGYARHKDWPSISESLEARQAIGHRAAELLADIGRCAAAYCEMIARQAAEAKAAEAEADTIPFPAGDDADADGPYAALEALGYEARPYELTDETTRDIHTSPNGYVVVTRETRTIRFRYTD